MDADYNLTAVFTKTAHVFEDGFETGDFSLWTGTTRTSGETTTISTDDKHHGSYSIVCARVANWIERPLRSWNGTIMIFGVWF